jgi:hypothetical protein
MRDGRDEGIHELACARGVGVHVEGVGPYLAAERQAGYPGEQPPTAEQRQRDRGCEPTISALASDVRRRSRGGACSVFLCFLNCALAFGPAARCRFQLYYFNVDAEEIGTLHTSPLPRDATPCAVPGVVQSSRRFRRRCLSFGTFSTHHPHARSASHPSQLHTDAQDTHWPLQRCNTILA